MARRSPPYRVALVGAAIVAGAPSRVHAQSTSHVQAAPIAASATGARPANAPTAPATTAPPTRAARQARASIAVLSGVEVSPLRYTPARVVIDATVRGIYRGFTAQPRAGVGFGGGIAPAGLVWTTRVGVGVGYSFAVAPFVVLSPMAGYDWVVYGPSGMPLQAHRVTGEVAVTFLIGERAVIDVYVQGGVYLAGATVDLAFALAPRFGVAF